ncbi:MAG TPA: alpha/beta hydrolase [Spirochaetia bacterium]|nr:alpha/beta hydrolase [Spirochaetia bacterium]
MKRGIVYATVGTRDLALDLYLPNDPFRAVPIIVFIHGGGWSALDRGWCPFAMRMLAEEYAVASIDYRLLQEGGAFPANLHDCKAAVRWLKRHAADYGLDGEHVAVWGDSAGAHLAAMVGLTGDVPELEGTVGVTGSSLVQACCCYHGAMDLLAWAGPDPDASPLRELFEKLIGARPLSRNLDKLRAASPVTWAGKRAAPSLLLHGDIDTEVPLSQTVLLYEALWKAGADVRLHVVHGGDHLHYKRSPPDLAWQAPEVRALEDAFFYRTLKGHERHPEV